MWFKCERKETQAIFKEIYFLENLKCPVNLLKTLYNYIL